MLQPVLISLFIFIPLFIIDHIIDLKIYLILPLSLISYFIVGYDVLWKSLKNIKRGQFLDENFLMVIATIGALIIGEYLEAVAVMIFYQVGEEFQEYAVNKSRKSISNLMDIKAEYATKINPDGSYEVIEPEDAMIGDLLLIKAGEKIPVDGIVVEGSTSLDVKALTGEAIPKEIKVGDMALSGSININGVITIEVVNEYFDSTVSKILDLVENAYGKKAKSENFITKFAKYYTPIVVGLACLLAFIPPIFLGDLKDWVFRALTFLVVSCPCALGLATPIAIMVGTGVCAKKGILIKDAEVFETLADVKTVVFDKTGTLTNGKPEVIDYTNKDVLELIYNIERLSSHPLANAITRKAEELKIDLREVKNFSNIPGEGVMGMIDEVMYYVGNLQLLKSLNIENINGIGKLINQNSKEGISVLALANDKEVLGLIKLRDEIKETSVEIINDLHKAGIEVVMLTGDKTETAEFISNKLGIDRYYAEVLPQDKQSVVKEIMKSGMLAMVGDGVNDAIALTGADIGIAIGGGTDIAIDSSDVVLLHNDLYGVVNVINLSKKVMKNIKINLFWAFFYNLIGIGLAAGALYYVNGLLLNPMICALAMSFSSVFVCTNALRINLFKGKEVKRMKKLTVPTMACMHCVKRIDEVLKKVKGLEKYSIVLEDKSVTLDTDNDKVINKAIQELKKAGYDCELYKD